MNRDSAKIIRPKQVGWRSANPTFLRLPSHEAGGVSNLQFYILEAIRKKTCQTAGLAVCNHSGKDCRTVSLAVRTFLRQQYCPSRGGGNFLISGFDPLAVSAYKTGSLETGILTVVPKKREWSSSPISRVIFTAAGLAYLNSCESESQLSCSIPSSS